jgi:predicted phage terminase large subunit-like protein
MAAKRLLDDISEEELAREFLARSQAKNSLMGFIKYTKPDFQAATHHNYLSDQLEAVIRGDIRRLIITMPPRHGKSEMASRKLPAYFLGKRPKDEIICATYNAELASEFGRSVRDLITSEMYTNVFPEVRIKTSDRAADRWSVITGGGYRAAGIGGGLTGRGGSLLLVDDPIKSREDADSKLSRDRAWDWYRSVLYTRQAPNAAIVVIQTRWHDDDLTGRLLREMELGGERWDKVDFPAIAESEDLLKRKPGQALWPAWFPLETLEKTRRTIGPREWSALYQQKPVGDEGEYFERKWVEDNYYDDRRVISDYHSGKHPMHIYGASDYAVTADGGDFTCHLVIGIDHTENIHLLDLWRKRTKTDEWIDAYIDLVIKWRPLRWAEEGGQILKSLGPFISARMKERRAYVFRETFASTSDKSARARSIQARMSMGMVKFPEHARWTPDMLHELTRFPAGANDDMVDVLSLVGRMLDKLSPAKALQFQGPVEYEKTTMGDIWNNHKRRRRGKRSRGGIIV